MNVTLEEGVRHPNGIPINYDMKLLGFGGMNLNDHYGSYTAKRMRDLQSYYGLSVTGKADESTLTKISEILSSPYREGVRHPDVIPLKKKLTALGYGNMNLNDHYGSFTKTRVKQFQRDHDLVVNGIADPVTLKKLNDLMNVTLEEGVRHPNVIPLKKD